MAPSDKDKDTKGITAAALRIRLKYADVETFLTKYSSHVTRTQLFLTTRTPKPVGTLVRFELLLSDGTKLLKGEGTVVGISAEGARTPGMTLKFGKLDADSRKLVNRIVAHRRAQGQPVSGTPAEVDGEGSGPIAIGIVAAGASVGLAEAADPPADPPSAEPNAVPVVAASSRVRPGEGGRLDPRHARTTGARLGGRRGAHRRRRPGARRHAGSRPRHRARRVGRRATGRRPGAPARARPDAGPGHPRRRLADAPRHRQAAPPRHAPPIAAQAFAGGDATNVTAAIPDPDVTREVVLDATMMNADVDDIAQAMVGDDLARVAELAAALGADELEAAVMDRIVEARRNNGGDGGDIEPLPPPPPTLARPSRSMHVPRFPEHTGDEDGPFIEPDTQVPDDEPVTGAAPPLDDEVELEILADEPPTGVPPPVPDDIAADLDAALDLAIEGAELDVTESVAGGAEPVGDATPEGDGSGKKKGFFKKLFGK